jgi:hypothetical protein
MSLRRRCYCEDAITAKTSQLLTTPSTAQRTTSPTPSRAVSSLALCWPDIPARQQWQAAARLSRRSRGLSIGGCAGRLQSEWALGAAQRWLCLCLVFAFAFAFTVSPDPPPHLDHFHVLLHLSIPAFIPVSICLFTSTHLHAPPRTSTHLHAPPRTSTHLHAPPRTSTHLHAPPPCLPASLRLISHVPHDDDVSC